MPHPRSIRRTVVPARRLHPAVAALCAGALLLAGCASATTGNGVLGSTLNSQGAGGAAPVAGPSGAPSVGASGGASGGPSGVPSTPTSGPSTPSTTPATPSTPATSAPATPYPSDYAQAILSAWGSHDLVRLTLLMDAADATHLLTLGDPDRHWTAVPGGGTTGSTYAQFYNNNGDWLVLKLNDNDLLSKLFHAGRLNTWDPISYPNDATAYAKEFVDGWIDGNQARITKLSSSAVTSYFLTLTTPDSSYTAGPAPGGGTAGHQHIEIKDAGTSLDTTLTIADQSLGGAHAIEDCTPGC